MDDNITYDNNEIISSIFFINRTYMTKDIMMWTSSCHLYDYKMTWIMMTWFFNVIMK